MNRLFAHLAVLSVATLALAACGSDPAKPSKPLSGADAMQQDREYLTATLQALGLGGTPLRPAYYTRHLLRRTERRSGRDQRSLGAIRSRPLPCEHRPPSITQRRRRCRVRATRRRSRRTPTAFSSLWAGPMTRSRRPPTTPRSAASVPARPRCRTLLPRSGHPHHEQGDRIARGSQGLLQP